MAQNELYEIQIDRDVRIPMRDGVSLSGDLYRPKGEGRWPVLVSRDGYAQVGYFKPEQATFFSQHGYVFINNNVRGRYLSEGEFFPMMDDGWGEHQDGYDVIEWTMQQPWCDGNVGMYGCSYAAFTQYLAAGARPPSLKACVPVLGVSVRDLVFQDGVYRLIEHRRWSLRRGENTLERMGELSEEMSQLSAEWMKAEEELDYWLRHLPLKELPVLAKLAPWYFEHIGHAQGDPWWDQMNARTRFSEIDVPMLHFGGWYDYYLTGALDHFAGIAAHGRSEATRRAQRLIVGPWMHEDVAVPPQPLDFGPNAAFDYLEAGLRWCDYWLKGEDNGVMEEAAVRLFLMGENRWLEMDQWPPTDVTYAPIYLGQGTGPSAVSMNNGRLGFALPTTNEPADSYRYDPEDPLPTIGVYQEELEGRMLTYTSEPLTEGVVVVGPVKAVLFASSSAPDTDWRVLLCDVEPDGHSRKVCDGILRARYRTSFSHEELMEPGQVYRFEIDLVATANAFLPGHRIRVDVTSSDFPWLDRNNNTAAPFGEEAVGQVAINTIYHDSVRPSHVVLPIMESRQR